MNDARFDPNRLGTALRQMAEDLATERRRVRLLQRQVRSLEAQLAALGYTSVSPAPPSRASARDTMIRVRTSCATGEAGRARPG